MKLRSPIVAPHYKITSYNSDDRYFVVEPTNNSKIVKAGGQLDITFASLPTMYSWIDGSEPEWFGPNPIFETPLWAKSGNQIRLPYRGVVLIHNFIFNDDQVAEMQDQLMEALAEDLEDESIWMAYFSRSQGLIFDFIPADGSITIAGSMTDDLGGFAGSQTDDWEFTMPTVTPEKWKGYKVLYIWYHKLGISSNRDFISRLEDSSFNATLGKYDFYARSVQRIEEGITQAKETLSNLLLEGMFEEVAAHMICVESIDPDSVGHNSNMTAGANASVVAATEEEVDLLYSIKQEIMESADGTIERHDYFTDDPQEYIDAAVPLIAAKVRDFYDL